LSVVKFKSSNSLIHLPWCSLVTPLRLRSISPLCYTF
jgi:hypothetical protein